MTVQDALNLYLATEGSRKALATQRLEALCARHVVEHLGGFQVAAIAAVEVDDLMQAMAERPVLANRSRSLVSQLLRWSARRGLRESTNPTKVVPTFRERRRTAFLSGDKRRRFLESARDLAGCGITQSASCVCQMMLLAGLRLREATDLRWEELDLQNGLLRLLPREIRGSNKTGEDRARPLTDEFLALMQKMPRRGPFVAPSPRTGRPYVDIRKAMTRILEHAGLEPITRHGLRHTFGTAGAEAGLTAPEIAGWLGHTSEASAKRYIHLAGSHLRQQHRRVAAAVGGRHA